MNIIELLGFVFGLAGVYLTIRQNVWCFPVGIVNVIISLYLFINQQLYSDAIQQGVYIILLSYGWYKWLLGNNLNQLPVTRINRSLFLLLLASVLSLTVAMGSLFHFYTDAAVPYLDAGATSLSFAAQYLIARKKIENWLIWIPVNMLYVGIYAYKELYLYVVLFTIYLVLAVAGYLNWKKQLNQSILPDIN